jgi:hypothetical protein
MAANHHFSGITAGYRRSNRFRIGSIIWGSREKLKGKQAAQNVIKYDT